MGLPHLGLGAKELRVERSQTLRGLGGTSGITVTSLSLYEAYTQLVQSLHKALAKLTLSLYSASTKLIPSKLIQS